MQIKNYLIVGLLIIIAILLLRKSYKGEYIATKSMLEDTVSTYRNKLNQEVAKINSIETLRKKDFLKLQVQDSVIQELQKVVKSNKKGVQYTILETTMVLKDTVTLFKDSMIVLNNNDTIYVDCYEYNNKWVDLSVCNDSLNLVVDNQQAIIFGYDKRKPFIEVTNYNPYVSTKTLRSYNVKTRKKRFGLGINISYSINQKLQLQPTIGVGLQYNIIQF